MADIYSLVATCQGFDISWLHIRPNSHNLNIRRFERLGLSNPVLAVGIDRNDAFSLLWGRGGSDVCPGLPRLRDGLKVIAVVQDNFETPRSPVRLL